MYIVEILKNNKGSVNRLVQLLTNAKEYNSENDFSKINHDVITNIIKLCFNDNNPEYGIRIKTIDENPGQFITIENETEKKYIQFSCDNETRNGYVLSKMVLALRMFVGDKTSKIKSFNVLLLDVAKDVYEKHNISARKNETDGVYEFKDLNTDNLHHSQIVTPYNTFAYRLLKTCDFTLMNEKYLPYKEYQRATAPRKPREEKSKTHKEYIDNEQLVKVCFNSIEELERTRNQLSSNNRGNNSSYFVIGQDTVVMYVKTYGNNQYEMMPIAYCLFLMAKRENKKLILYQVKDGNNTTPIGQQNKEFLEGLGVKVYSDLEEYTKNPNAIIEEKEDSRDQITFKKNLILKYGPQKCYLCGCDIRENIIASHIQRVADINKLNIPPKEKWKKAIDGNNGFWLCANHDKMFEYGIITFNEETGEFVLGQDYLNSRELTEQQKNFIQEITKENEISKEHFTKELSEYLKIHNERIKKLNQNR